MNKEGEDIKITVRTERQFYITENNNYISHIKL